MEVYLFKYLIKILPCKRINGWNIWIKKLCEYNYDKKAAYQASNTIANVSDYLLWYAKSIDKVKIRPLYISKLDLESIGLSKFIEMPDGKRRTMTDVELEGTVCCSMEQDGMG